MKHPNFFISNKFSKKVPKKFSPGKVKIKLFLFF